jgi:uncharacterized radical SAM protein YgiQ
MVTNYTAAKKKRRVDVYRPGGKPGRPNRATIAYTALARHHFPGVPVIAGGLEAGPRRLAHYDYWDDRVRRSILVDAKADLLAWGMAEPQVLAIAERLRERRPLSGLAGTCEILAAAPRGARIVPSFEELRDDPGKLVELFHAVREENSPSSRSLAQAHGARWVVQHPPLPPPSQAEIDSFYDLPYRREWHPITTRQAACPRSSPCAGASTRTAAAWPTARFARSRSTKVARSRAVRPSRSCAKPRASLRTTTSAARSPTWAGRRRTCTAWAASCSKRARPVSIATA